MGIKDRTMLKLSIYTSIPYNESQFLQDVVYRCYERTGHYSEYISKSIVSVKIELPVNNTE